MSSWRMWPLVFVLAVLAEGWGADPIPADELRGGQTWTLLGGQLSIELPPDWGPVGLGEVRTPFDQDGSRGMAMCRPDRMGFCVIYRFEGRGSMDNAESLRRALMQNCDEVGIRTEECIVNLIDKRRFAIAHGSYIEGERNVSLVVAATVLDGGPVIIVFGAKGPDRNSLILAGQMALLSLKLSEEGGLKGIDYPIMQPETATAAGPGPKAGIHMTSRVVPGTGVTLMVPAHLGPALRSPGYIAQDLGVFVFVEPLGLPYLQALGFMNSDFLSRNGKNLESSAEVEVDGRKARLCGVSFESQRGPVSAWVLLTGEGDKSLKVEAQFPKSQATDFSELLREGILQTVWVPGPDPYGFDDLDYTYDESSHLKTICRAHDRVVLAMKRSAFPVLRTGPLVLIDSSMSPGPYPDLASAGRNVAMTTNLVMDVEIVGEGETQFAGFRVHEIHGTATEQDTGTLMYFYQAVLHQEGRCLVVHGIQDMYDHADLRDEFIQVTRSVRLKVVNN